MIRKIKFRRIDAKIGGLFRRNPYEIGAKKADNFYYIPIAYVKWYMVIYPGPLKGGGVRS